MVQTLDNPVEALIARLNSGQARWIVGMAGLPGSGKSTLAARLEAEVNARSGPNTMAALSMDGFHLTKAELSAMPDPVEVFARRGAPWTFRPEALIERLRAVRRGAGREEVGWPSFIHEVGDPLENAVKVSAATRLVLVEGIYLLHRADGWEGVGALFDERWYLDTSLDIAVERLAGRHMVAYGMTREEAATRIASNDRLNAEIVSASKYLADWRLSSPA